MNKVEQRLKIKYQKEVAQILGEEFGIKNVNAVPKIVKVVINSGVGSLVKSKEQTEQFKKDLSVITGQSVSIRNAKISVASFSVRKGMPVGMQVTLRGERMWAFLDKVIAIVLPRLRDFRGVSLRSFDNFGNYTIGFGEHTVFPEIDVTKTTPHGFEMTVVTTAKNKEISKRLLELLGMPFAKKE